MIMILRKVLLHPKCKEYWRNTAGRSQKHMVINEDKPYQIRTISQGSKAKSKKQRVTLESCMLPGYTNNNGM